MSVGGAISFSQSLTAYVHFWLLWLIVVHTFGSFDCCSSFIVWCLTATWSIREQCKTSWSGLLLRSKPDATICTKTRSTSWLRPTSGRSCACGSSTSLGWKSRESTAGDCSANSSRRRWRKGLILKLDTSAPPLTVSSILTPMYGGCMRDNLPYTH